MIKSLTHWYDIMYSVVNKVYKIGNCNSMHICLIKRVSLYFTHLGTLNVNSLVLIDGDI